MIYQFYFLPEQKNKLFNLPLYRGFGLEPEVNPNITKNCPELESPLHRKQIVSFGGMFHLWRNMPNDGHDWIGFTSYRQLDKSKVIFKEEYEITEKLKDSDIISWQYCFFDIDLASSSEEIHQGIMNFIVNELGIKISKSFYECGDGAFAEYYAMKKNLFNDFMVWLEPVLQYGLFLVDGIYRREAQIGGLSNHYLLTASNALGFALERLFIVWYMEHNLKIHSIEPKKITISQKSDKIT